MAVAHRRLHAWAAILMPTNCSAFIPLSQISPNAHAALTTQSALIAIAIQINGVQICDLQDTDAAGR